MYCGIKKDCLDFKKGSKGEFSQAIKCAMEAFSVGKSIIGKIESCKSELSSVQKAKEHVKDALKRFDSIGSISKAMWANLRCHSVRIIKDIVDGVKAMKKK